jgi:putative thioredoxin
MLGCALVFIYHRRDHPLRMTASLIFDVTEHDFTRKVLKASRMTPVLVDFWAEWCPPCRALTPVLERVVSHHRGQLLLAKIDADENMKLGRSRYPRQLLPALLYLLHPWSRVYRGTRTSLGNCSMRYSTSCIHAVVCVAGSAISCAASPR